MFTGDNQLKHNINLALMKKKKNERSIAVISLQVGEGRRGARGGGYYRGVSVPRCTSVTSGRRRYIHVCHAKTTGLRRAGSACTGGRGQVGSVLTYTNVPLDTTNDKNWPPHH